MTYVRLLNPPLEHDHKALIEREGDNVFSVTFLDERRPAGTTGSWVDVWQRLDRPRSRGSRRNLIMCAGAILNAKYERQRAEWRLVTPLVSKEQIAAGDG